MKKFTILFFVALFMIVSASTIMGADEYPSKAITIVVSYGAGGMCDTSTRILSEKMSEYLDTEVVVENRPGGGGLIAIKHVANQEPDGYTINSHTIPSFGQAVLLGQEIDVDNYAFIGSYMPQQRVIFSPKDRPWDTFEGFVEYAKENPGVLTVGSGGDPWMLNVLKAVGKEEGINLNYILFESGAAGSAAIVGGHVDVCETGVGTPAWQAAKKGDLNILAVGTSGDLEEFGYPDVKNLDEMGYKFTSTMRYGMLAPAGTPEDRVQKLQDALEYAINHEDVIKRFENINLQHDFVPGDEYKQMIKENLEEIPELQKFVEDVE